MKRCEEENRCIGHIVPQLDKCRKCKPDEFNVFCESYVPVHLYFVIGEQVNKEYQKNE